MRLHPAWVDLALVLAVLAGAGLLFVGASTLPPPRFEPMGSAALPRILGSVLVFFALIIAVKAILQLRGNRDGIAVEPSTTQALPGKARTIMPGAHGETDSVNHSETVIATVTGTDSTVENSGEKDEPALTGQLRGACVFATLILYILALDILQWPFIPVTAVFVTIVGTALSHQRLQALWKFAVFGLLLATALYLVMTRFLYVDLG